MTGEQLSALESRLWTAADQLRANSKLTATEYSFPVLGIILLRHAHKRNSFPKDNAIQKKCGLNFPPKI